MIILDSTTVDTFATCNRKGFFNKLYRTNCGALGVEPVTTGVDLTFGIAVHRGLEHLGKEEYVNAYTYSALELNNVGDDDITLDGLLRRDELKAICYGLIRTADLLWMPTFRKEYKIIATEQELVIELSPSVWYATRVDWIVERLCDSARLNWNHKTTSSPDDVYRELQYSNQLLMEAESASQQYGFVGGTVILALDKGRKQYATSGDLENGKVGWRRASPFAYAYKKVSALPGAPEYSPVWKAKWERVPVWQEMGSEEWMNYLIGKHPEICRAALVQLPPIYHDPRRVEEVKQQLISIGLSMQRGQQLVQDGQKIMLDGTTADPLNVYFPQSTKHCFGLYKQQCSFVHVCHRGISADDAEFYRPRRINHPIESTLSKQ